MGGTPLDHSQGMEIDPTNFLPTSWFIFTLAVIEPQGDQLFELFSQRTSKNQTHLSDEFNLISLYCVLKCHY